MTVGKGVLLTGGVVWVGVAVERLQPAHTQAIQTKIMTTRILLAGLMAFVLASFLHTL